MLIITIPATEGWDESKQEFVSIEPAQTLQLEHSLISLSKWESKWCKPFLSSKDKTDEEILDYIKFMTITKNVKPGVYNRLTKKIIDEINDYIDKPMTATTFSGESGSNKNGERITSELIYYWMIALNIPIEECQKWHLNRLLTLIKVCNIKNQPEKKMSSADVAAHYAELNAKRKKELGTKG